jgi:uncharacterized protein with PQ loop repeat
MIAAIGSILLALCGLPEAVRAFKLKRCDIGWGMLLMWLFGELCLVIFALQTKQYVLLINYFANILFLAIMIFYKISPDPLPLIGDGRRQL